MAKNVPAYHVAVGNPTKVMRPVGSEVATEPKDVILNLEDALRMG